MKKILSLCSVVALAATISAQTTTPKGTIPVGYLKKSGNYHQWGAFRYSQGRHQSFYSPAAAGSISAPVVISQLRLRPHQSTRNLASFVREWEIVISSKGSQWKVPTRTSFAGNHGTDNTIFMKRTRFNLPAVGATPSNPQPWASPFKGAKPFIVLKGEGLVIDVKSYSKTYDGKGWYADAVHDGMDYGGTKALNSGCPPNFVHVSDRHRVSARYSWLTFGLTRGYGDLAFTWIGAKKVSIAFPPKSGCTLFTLPMIVHPRLFKTTTSQGMTRAWSWGKVPAFMVGKTLISQMGAITPKGQLKLSNGIEVTFGKGKVPGLGIQAVYGYGSGYNPDTSAPKYGPDPYGVIFGRD
jgi:hypothetical protein